MDRKGITAFLIECQPDEFMAYADQDEKGTFVVGPDGKKYRFSNDQLDQSKILMEEKIRQMTLNSPNRHGPMRITDLATR